MKKINNIKFEKNGWKLTPESVALLATRKEKAVLNAGIQLIGQELRANKVALLGIGSDINCLETPIKTVSGNLEKITDNLEKLTKLTLEIIEKDDSRAWRFEIRRDSSNNIKEVVAKQV